MEYKPPRQHIGPSQFATILGFNKFQTPDELRKELEHGSYKSITEAQNFGIDHEARALRHYETVRKCRLIQPRWKKRDRILGRADALIEFIAGSEKVGLEIKCHYKRDYPLSSVPIYYMAQLVGYMWLYDYKHWDLMSCCFDEKGKILRHSIHRINWDDWSSVWEESWWPCLRSFIESVKWSERAE